MEGEKLETMCLEIIAFKKIGYERESRNGMMP